MKATILDKDFDPSSLPTGMYVSSSDSKAYSKLMAMVLSSSATLLGERYLNGGAKAINVYVDTGIKKNSSEYGNQMEIGPEFFVGITRGYKNFQECWWRECIQNSVDAGATEIYMDLAEREDGTWTVSCTDNGRGMDENTLLKKFLKFGGTTKVDQHGITGGFGKAKELILLPWISWSVKTRDTYVTGSGASFKDPKKIHNEGLTEVTAVMPSDKRTTREAAISFIKKCYKPDIKFYVSEYMLGKKAKEKQIFADLSPGKEIPRANLTGKASTYFNESLDTNNALIRVNGLFMFDKFVCDNLNGSIIVELIGKSTELLSDNRNSFADDRLERFLLSFFSVVSKDTESATKASKNLFTKIFIGKGNDSFESMQSRLLMQFEEMSTIGSSDQTVEDATAESVSELVGSMNFIDSEYLGLGATKPVAEAILKNVDITGQSMLEAVCKQLVWSPNMMISNELEGYHPTKEFFPDTMSQEVKELLRFWTELCRYVLIQLNSYKEFGVGFCFSEKALAQCKKGDDDVPYLLLNPYAYGNRVLSPSNGISASIFSKVGMKNLYASAVHECTHMANVIHYHDESFSCALTTNFATCSPGFSTVPALLKAIREKHVPQKPVESEYYEKVMDVSNNMLGHVLKLQQLLNMPDLTGRSIERFQTDARDLCVPVSKFPYALMYFDSDKFSFVNGYTRADLEYNLKDCKSYNIDWNDCKIFLWNKQKVSATQIETEHDLYGVIFEYWKDIPDEKKYPEFKVIYDEHCRIGLPKVYVNDLLVHDMRRLVKRNNSKMPFIWAVIESGCGIYSPDQDNFKETIIAIKTGMCSKINYLWDGSKLELYDTLESLQNAASKIW